MSHFDSKRRGASRGCLAKVCEEPSIASATPDPVGSADSRPTAWRRDGRLDRLLRIRETLNTTFPMTIDALAVKFQVAPRTIYRDLKTMIDAGIPIIYDDLRGGYVLTRSAASPFQVTRDETLGLLLVLTAAPVQTFPILASAAQEMLSKLMDRLPREQRFDLQAVVESLPLTDLRLNVAQEASLLLDQLVEGIAQRHDMRISYRLTPEGRLASTRISPLYRLDFAGGNWRIEARSSQHRTRWRFSLNQIVSIEFLPPAKEECAERSELISKDALLPVLTPTPSWGLGASESRTNVADCF